MQYRINQETVLHEYFPLWYVEKFKETATILNKKVKNMFCLLSSTAISRSFSRPETDKRGIIWINTLSYSGSVTKFYANIGSIPRFMSHNWKCSNSLCLIGYFTKQTIWIDKEFGKYWVSSKTLKSEWKNKWIKKIK
jgi:hypothetical protein